MQTGRRGHPSRQPRGDSSERGSRGRGRGRGRGPSDNSRGSRGSHRGARPSPAYSPVPPYASIHPGTPVSLILKQDQPTGRRVSGIVADILTRGDHPRGVKVRLRDGRVGRVQSLVSETEGESGEALAGGADAGLGRDGEVRGGGRGRMERDVRENDEYFFDETRRGEVDGGIFAALEEADRRYEQGKGGHGGGVETAVCPVCGVFEGDEVAVARHVESHFGE